MHTFHIPVMGLSYTVDTPIKVARFGISSVVSIIEDNLIERMRAHHYRQFGEPYVPISRTEPDFRAGGTAKVSLRQIGIGEIGAD